MIILTGGTGLLGTTLQRWLKMVCPTHEQMDVLDKDKTIQVCSDLFKKDPEGTRQIIHCAACTDVARAETDEEYRKVMWYTNIVGTENVCAAAQENDARLTYISTDYVFDGRKGRYSETDLPNPSTFYGLTKLLGEFVTRNYEKVLVVRTSFVPDTGWPHPKAPMDRWTSGDRVTLIAGEVSLTVGLPNIAGVIHIGTNRKTIWWLANKCKPGVPKTYLDQIGTPYGIVDTSFDLTLWKKVREDATIRFQAPKAGEENQPQG